MIIKCRKLPIIVEAMQFTGTRENLHLLQSWSKDQVWLHPSKDVLMVKCLEALAETPSGSYVVKGVKGEVWPVRQDIFEETYEVLK